MKVKTTISITEGRKNIFAIADEVQKNNIAYTLTQNGKPKVVVMSAEQYESWKETLDVMREIPDLKKDIEETKKDFESGDYKNYKTLEEFLAEENYMVADVGKVKYVSSNNIKIKSRKRTKKNTTRRKI